MIELKKKLLNNPYHIENILEKYGFSNIEVNSREIRCGLNESTNNTSIRIKLNDKLTANDFGRDIHGDLFSLIMKCKKVELKDILHTAKEELGISRLEFNKTKKIFGGFYDNIRVRNGNNIEVKKYDENVMAEYVNKYNTKFLRDGISFETQKKFKVGICHSQLRISVPWFDFEGSLVGIEGRYIGDHKKDEVPKWFPLIPFPKSQFLYGYYQNYYSLQESETIYIGESSKFTMQLDSMGIFNGVALGGNSIHPNQIKQLSWLSPKKVIFCFDEGLEQDLIDRQVEKTKTMLKFLGVKVGLVNDKKNELLKKGSKNSPSDIGIEGFKKLINEHVEWR